MLRPAAAVSVCVCAHLVAAAASVGARLSAVNDTLINVLSAVRPCTTRPQARTTRPRRDRKRHAIKQKATRVRQSSVLVYSYARPEPVLITTPSRGVVSLLLSYAFRLLKTSLSLKTDKLSLSLLLVNA